jgi:translation initiation factor IF-1
MAKRGAVVVGGVVVELLPRALVRVRIGADRHVIAHLDAGPQRDYVRVLVGDRVQVELSPHDRGRGRVVRRGTGE